MSATHEELQASIRIDLKRVLGDIDKRLYSGFTEHMGRCIYGGIYEPGPLADEHGFRKDVMSAMKELRPPIVRYPGGNFVSNYHWMDGIGPTEARPRRIELAWLGVESNQFGTDEFMKWCSELGTEPYICLNMGSGTMEEAMNWVEYMNSSADTYYANLRRKHGRAEPYGVKYIGLGNEMWGPWQIGQLTAEEYAAKARRWAKAIKLIDPSIKLVSCGKEGSDDWDWIVIRELVDLIDYHSIHLYTKATLYEPFHIPDLLSPKSHLVNVMSPLAAEVSIKIVDQLLELARLQKKTKNKPKIAFDEWNVWDAAHAPGEQGAEMHYNLSDALAVATWLNIFIRQSQKVAMANIAQAVNVISPILTNPSGLVRQTTYHVLWLYSKFFRGTALDVHVTSPLYDGPTYPSWLAHTSDLPFIDSVASYNSTEETVSLSLVNRHDERSAIVNIDIAGFIDGSDGRQTLKAERYTLTGPLDAMNTFEEQEKIKPVTAQVVLGARVEIPPATLYIYIVKLK